MAIKKGKTAKKEVQLPDSLDGILKRGFTASVLEKRFKEDAKGARSEAYEFLDQKKEGFDIDKHIDGSSLRTEYGRVTIVSKPTIDIDRDGLIELVKDGKVTIETLLNIASFPSKDLKTALGDKVFGEVSTIEDKEHLQLSANAEFKSLINDEFGDEKKIDIVKELKKTDKPKKKISSLDKIRQAKSKKKADSDLEDILSG